MKELKKSARLTVGCVFALSLITNIPAQAQTLPSATYHSAKDPDLPGLPFNPFPGVPIWEVEAGLYLVDDTGIPDTPGQAASREKRENAARWADKIANDPAASRAAKEAHQAAQEADWQRNLEAITPWLHHDLRKLDGSADTLADRQAAKSAQMITLTRALAEKAEKDHADVAAYLAARGLHSRVFELPDGRIAAIVAIENGIPRVQTACNVEAADTVGTDELWPGGSTGLGLSGTNVLMAMWDERKVREQGALGFYTTSGERLTNMQPNIGYSPHSTHVAGTLLAAGTGAGTCSQPFAQGMSYNGRVLAWDFDDDTVEMAGAVVTNALRLSNHSYAIQAGWGSRQISSNSPVYSFWFGDLAVSTNEDYHFGFYSSFPRPLTKSRILPRRIFQYGLRPTNEAPMLGWVGLSRHLKRAISRQPMG